MPAATISPLSNREPRSPLLSSGSGASSPSSQASGQPSPGGGRPSLPPLLLPSSERTPKRQSRSSSQIRGGGDHGSLNTNLSNDVNGRRGQGFEERRGEAEGKQRRKQRDEDFERTQAATAARITAALDAAKMKEISRRENRKAELERRRAAGVIPPTSTLSKDFNPAATLSKSQRRRVKDNAAATTALRAKIAAVRTVAKGVRWHTALHVRLAETLAIDERRARQLIMQAAIAQRHRIDKAVLQVQVQIAALGEANVPLIEPSDIAPDRLSDAVHGGLVVIKSPSRSRHPQPLGGDNDMRAVPSSEEVPSLPAISNHRKQNHVAASLDTAPPLPTLTPPPSNAVIDVASVADDDRRDGSESASRHGDDSPSHTAGNGNGNVNGNDSRSPQRLVSFCGGGLDTPSAATPVQGSFLGGSLFGPGGGGSGVGAQWGRSVASVASRSTASRDTMTDTMASTATGTPGYRGGGHRRGPQRRSSMASSVCLLRQRGRDNEHSDHGVVMNAVRLHAKLQLGTPVGTPARAVNTPLDPPAVNIGQSTSKQSNMTTPASPVSLSSLPISTAGPSPSSGHHHDHQAPATPSTAANTTGLGMLPAQPHASSTSGASTSLPTLSVGETTASSTVHAPQQQVQQLPSSSSSMRGVDGRPPLKPRASVALMAAAMNTKDLTLVSLTEQFANNPRRVLSRERAIHGDITAMLLRGGAAMGGRGGGGGGGRPPPSPSPAMKHNAKRSTTRTDRRKAGGDAATGGNDSAKQSTAATVSQRSHDDSWEDVPSSTEPSPSKCTDAHPSKADPAVSHTASEGDDSSVMKKLRGKSRGEKTRAHATPTPTSDADAWAQTFSTIGQLRLGRFVTRRGAEARSLYSTNIHEFLPPVAGLLSNSEAEKMFHLRAATASDASVHFALEALLNEGGDHSSSSCGASCGATTTSAQDEESSQGRHENERQVPGRGNGDGEGEKKSRSRRDRSNDGRRRSSSTSSGQRPVQKPRRSPHTGQWALYAMRLLVVQEKQAREELEHLELCRWDLQVRQASGLFIARAGGGLPGACGAGTFGHCPPVDVAEAAERCLSPAMTPRGSPRPPHYHHR